MLFSLTSFSQNRQDYFVLISNNYDLGMIEKTTKTDQTLDFSVNNASLTQFLNTIPTYTFEKAFPTSQRPRLQRVYLLSVLEGTSIVTILQRTEVEDVELIDQNIMLLNDEAPSFGIIPNDYEDIITGVNNTALDLIKAPLAWTISTGENVLVGVSDSKIDLNHEDLLGQVIEELDITPRLEKHGTGVAGAIAANTNNGVGISSLAHNSKIISAPNTGYSRVLALSQIPSVRVINCSWISSCSLSTYFEEMYKEIADNGVLVVAGAGNGKPAGEGGCGSDGNGYAYPASYESTISVTSVGSRFPIGHYHDLILPGETTVNWWRSWIDCHAGRPDFGQGGHTHNDKVDVTAPGILVLGITDNYTEHPSGYKLSIGTSIATPFVTALAALIFSVNPSLTPAQVKDIIKTTADDIYYIPYNQPYIGLLGTGRINAYRAVKKAQCMLNPTTGIDLAMQDSNVDSFEEPNTETQYPWRSEDIWVRNQNDGLLIKVHENPEYSPNSPNYVYVRVTNNSCEASTGTDNLKLYWAKASTALSWPLHWEGGLTMTDPDTEEEILMGDQIATLSIPPLEIGQEAIIEFEWNDMPNPLDYENINPDPWHFCLLARIDTPNDPMTFPEGEAITQNVLNNNNIAWKNTTVVDIIPDEEPSPIGGVVAVGNYFSQQKTFTLELVKENNELGKSIYEEAEVTIQMDDVLYNAWEEGGKISQNIDSTKVASKRVITDNNAIFDNIILEPNEIGTLYLTFNFLTKELTNKREFIYHLIQRDAVTNEIIGGETFEVRKKPRDSFDADAGNDKEIDKNETITISAGQISEDAVYNWYGPEGNLIYTGTDLTISPDVTKKYKLEIISTIDGFKDYDEVEVTVNPYKLESLVPNPASQSFTVNYITDGASSAYVMMVNMNTGNSDNYILDIQETNTTIDVSAYTTGLYNIILVCDGEVQNSKTLIKQ
ncbi:MAG: S8 family serine peptidase [Flavobacteriaceae bacterium]|nr:S8 family serine peptidase [Flavobacteriaceae bacterium]